jgi:hypothetical protein
VNLHDRVEDEKAWHFRLHYSDIATFVRVLLSFVIIDHHPPSSKLSCERIWRKFHLEWARPRSRSAKTEENSDLQLHTIAVLSLASSLHRTSSFQVSSIPSRKSHRGRRKIVSQFLSFTKTSLPQHYCHYYCYSCLSHNNNNNNNNNSTPFFSFHKTTPPTSSPHNIITQS